LASPAKQLKDDLILEDQISEYASLGFQYLMSSLSERFQTQVLDLGLVNNEKINFLARKISRVYICDIFSVLKSELSKNRSLKSVSGILNYSPQSFDGILFWDLIDRLDAREATEFVEHCQSLLNPDGIILLMSRDQNVQDMVFNYSIISDTDLQLRPKPHLSLPSYYLKNREILELFSHFNFIKSFIYRNHIREFLFRRS